MLSNALDKSSRASAEFIFLSKVSRIISLTNMLSSRLSDIDGSRFGEV